MTTQDWKPSGKGFSPRLDKSMCEKGTSDRDHGKSSSGPIRPRSLQTVQHLIGDSKRNSEQPRYTSDIIIKWG
ncbi:hypothetical protein D5F53_14315 [Paenibacillus lautus]|uniref:Uncharacterized protein n=1 Tax=Paenibacillus lautus TaxID=1401 RepID=A0A385TIQ0_PAELA|nr:hypothetical protein D5F53_14315 [Paenibacillus lautus]